MTRSKPKPESSAMKTLPFLLLGCLATACVADLDIGLTKQEVRAMDPGDRDFCDEEGWYGDGECDDFCLYADADCASTCIATGCSGQICADEDVITTCEFREEYTCYQNQGECARQADGECGWTDTEELRLCLQPAVEPAACRATGCSGQVCADEDVITTCEFLPEYACYQDHGECARQVDGECGWTDTEELDACLNPTVEPEACRRTGCSGQICAAEDVDSTCEFLPEYACFQEHGVCETQTDGACGWTPSEALTMCIEDAGAMR